MLTPQIARHSVDHDKIPFLNGGNLIPLSTTLRELKYMIATHLGVQVRIPLTETPSPECNCNLARSVAKHGIWEMLHCRTWQGYGEYAASHDCSGVCALCGRHLADSCRTCLNEDSNDNDRCPLVINAGCRHVFHHHCYIQRDRIENGVQLCPGGCPQGVNFLSLYVLMLRNYAQGDDTGLC